VPNEISKVCLPPYVIEPPDILLIESPYGLPDQPIGGEHLVRPDGTVGLGTYGSVPVAGLTLDQAREAITAHLLQFLQAPLKVNVDVFAYNSKVYYIIMDGAGYGDQVVRLPATGNETVLDALSLIGGLPPVASKRRIWLARPVPDGGGCQIMPVNWLAITRCGSTATNYQILPGDRIFVQSDRLLALDGAIAKIVTPMERLFGVTLLGSATVSRLQNMGRGAVGGGF
jgi:polysaccharide export outer membrane protein